MKKNQIKVIDINLQQRFERAAAARIAMQIMAENYQTLTNEAWAEATKLYKLDSTTLYNYNHKTKTIVWTENGQVET